MRPVHAHNASLACLVPTIPLPSPATSLERFETIGRWSIRVPTRSCCLNPVFAGTYQRRHGLSLL